jgi:diadenosine tetraphosphate (Ap4A) HIT family hydrolase
MACRLCNENNNQNALFIEQGRYWNVHACWFQHTIGTLGIILRRHVESFVELSEDEIKELGQLLQTYEIRLSNKLQPNWFNIQLNANWNHHLHFLLLPRYKDKKKFNKKEYTDPTFGDPITYTKQEESQETRLLLTSFLE